MAMGERKCKYCGTPTHRKTDLCSACSLKLKLVRQLLNMVKDYKKRVKGDV
jgi:hypothetical protein